MRTLVRLALGLLALGAVACAGGLIAFQAIVLRGLPDLRSLDDYRPNLVTRVYSRDGQLIGEFYRERREIVPIERVPAHVVHAFVSAEDDAFYRHEGLDYASILRAAWANLRAGGIRQGGSTITQQVAKTFLLSSERTFLRKLRDMVLAKRIEEHLDKNEILFLYLNQIYLGSGAYGIEAAAQTYYRKSVDELSLGEAALIAGLVRAPSRDSPFHDMSAAEQRQSYVLRRMFEEGYISAEERDQALEQPVELAEQQQDEVRKISAHFVEEVRRYLFERLGAERALTEGLHVWTTLRVPHQRAAYAAVRNGLRDHDHRQGYRGPLRAVPPEEWSTVLAELTEMNGPPPWDDGTRLRALVLEVDREGERARLGLGENQETSLGIEEVAWARPPNPEVDGMIAQLRHIRSALKPGYLVELEKVGEDGEGGPIPRFALHQEPLAEGALLAMEIPSGHVPAMIGGYSYERSEFNRAVQSRRQPGSAFKPIIYATALDQGYTPATIVYDTPIVYEDLQTGIRWKPENYEEKFYGPITVREAIARSRNIATIKLLRDVRVGPVVRKARELGIRSPLEPDLSLALGSSELTLAELLRAYSTFPAAGKLLEPVFVLEVRDRDGALLERDVSLFAEELEVPEEKEEEEPVPRSELEQVLSQIREAIEPDTTLPMPDQQALDPVTAFLMTNLLRAVVQEGTGWRIKQLGRPVGGKTGTTNDLHDAWFLGFTPDLAAGVWIGYDSPRTLGKNETGSRAASPIFLDYMQRVLAGVPPSDFEAPEGVVFARIDRKTGLLATHATEQAVFQAFREGTAPTEISWSGSTFSPELPPRLD